MRSISVIVLVCCIITNISFFVIMPVMRNAIKFGLRFITGMDYTGLIKIKIKLTFWHRNYFFNFSTHCI